MDGGAGRAERSLVQGGPARQLLRGSTGFSSGGIAIPS